MKKIFSVILILIFSVNSFAAPFKNEVWNAIYADNNQCNLSAKDLKCSDMDINSSHTGVCNTSKYQGFVSVNGKTYAVTKQAIAFADENNLAKITSDLENMVIADILKFYGISQAFIGGLDKSHSTEYNSKDISRFKWFDGSAITYSNFSANEPNNFFSADMIGSSSIYGEHWLAIDSNGKWADVGDIKLPAIVEFKGSLSCVSGKVKQTGSNITEDYYACANGANEFNVTILDKCTEGVIFDTTQIGYICNSTKEACVKSEVIIGYEDKVTEIEREEIVEEVFELELPFGATANLYRNNELLKLLENIPITINTYCYEYSGGSDAGGFYWEPCIKTISRDKVIKFDEPYYNCTDGDGGGCEWNMVKLTTKILTTSSSFDIKVIDNNGSVNATWQEKTPFTTLCREWVGSSDSGGYSFVSCTQDIVDNLQWSFTPTLSGEFVSSALVGNQFIVKVRKKVIDTIIEKIPIYKTVYTCPSTNRPCIKSGEDYFCSTECINGNVNSGNVSEDTNVEGENDANNNGTVEADGTCNGEWVFFPGKDSRCRLPGIQTKYTQCCSESQSLDQANKPDITIPKEAFYFIEWLSGGQLWWLILIAQNIDFDVCTGAERQLSVNRPAGYCREIGDYCAEKWLGTGCVQKKNTYCCFDSEFSRAFNEAGMDLLNKSWGAPESPNCGGFSPDELQRLSAMNIADHPKMREFGDRLGAKFQGKMMNEFQNSLNFDSINKDIENLKEKNK